MLEVIDSHVHLYPPEINRNPAGWAAGQGERAWALLATRQRRDGSAVQVFPSMGELLAAMDATGIARAVLLGWYWETAAACQFQNRFYAECIRAHGDRFAACAAVQPGAGSDAVRRELRWAREQGFRGIGELSPHAQGYPASDPVLAEVMGQAEAWGWPVNFHVTDPAGNAYPGRVETLWADFTALAAAHPRTDLILAHWGGFYPLTEQSERPQNFYYDTAASPLLAGAQIWTEFLAAVGPDRVLFGSDFPLNSYPKLDRTPNLGRLLAEIRAAGLSPDALAGLLRGNALRWFA